MDWALSYLVHKLAQAEGPMNLDAILGHCQPPGLSTTHRLEKSKGHSQKRTWKSAHVTHRGGASPPAVHPLSAAITTRRSAVIAASLQRAARSAATNPCAVRARRSTCPGLTLCCRPRNFTLGAQNLVRVWTWRLYWTINRDWGGRRMQQLGIRVIIRVL